MVIFLSKEYKDGWQAAKTGKDIKQNPYILVDTKIYDGAFTDKEFTKKIEESGKHHTWAKGFTDFFTVRISGQDQYYSFLNVETRYSIQKEKCKFCEENKENCLVMETPCCQNDSFECICKDCIDKFYKIFENVMSERKK
jgi:hypothetical protein